MFFGKSRILTFRPHPPTRRRRRLVPFPLPPGFPRQSPFWKVGKKTRLFSPGPSLRPSSPPEAFSCNTRASARKFFFFQSHFSFKKFNFSQNFGKYFGGENRGICQKMFGPARFSKFSEIFGNRRRDFRNFPKFSEIAGEIFEIFRNFQNSPAKFSKFSEFFGNHRRNVFGNFPISENSPPRNEMFRNSA